MECHRGTGNVGNVVFTVFVNGLDKGVEHAPISFGDDSESGGPVNMLNSRTAIQSDFGERNELTEIL